MSRCPPRSVRVSTGALDSGAHTLAVQGRPTYSGEKGRGWQQASDDQAGCSASPGGRTKRGTTQTIFTHSRKSGRYRKAADAVSREPAEGSVSTSTRAYTAKMSSPLAALRLLLSEPRVRTVLRRPPTSEEPPRGMPSLQRNTPLPSVAPASSSSSLVPQYLGNGMPDAPMPSPEGALPPAKGRPEASSPATLAWSTLTVIQHYITPAKGESPVQP